MNTAKDSVLAAILTAITLIVSGSKLMNRLMISFAIGVLFAMPLASIAQEDSTRTTFSNYARYGADVWARNPAALKSGEGKACISCHTSLPYALVEPLLDGDYPAYRDMIKHINNRIRTWSDKKSFYSGKKLDRTAALANLPPDSLKKFIAAEWSCGVEAVLNALIRATHDAYSGLPPQQETRAAFRNMWEEQI